MPKAIPAQVIAQMDAVSARPVLLFELGLDVGTLRFSATKTNIVFPTGVNTYTAKAIQTSNIQQTIDDQISRITVSFDNVLGDMAGYNNAEKFEGKTLSVKKVYRDALGDSTYYIEMFFGYMLEPKIIDYYWLTLDAVIGSILQEKSLQDFYQVACNRIFGDAKCNYNGFANLTTLTASGTADSGSSSTLVDNALTQTENYWKYGRIKITKSGVVYYRDIINFVANIAAQGTITMAGIAIANETFVIDSQTFTWKAVRSIAGEVTIGATAAAAVTNIVAAVTADLASVTAVDGAGDTVVITAVTAKGTDGNAIVFTEASTNMTVNGTGTLGATTAGVDSITTFDVELPVSVANGDTYTVYKGCSNTWNACQSNEVYGPSSDNKANFLGFIHIGDQL